MDFTAQTQVVDVVPRIGRTGFAEVLRDHDSPAAEDALVAWDAIAAEGVDPLFALAIFARESQLGKAGVCAEFDLRNPGHTRTSRTGSGETVDTSFGPFIRYPSWREGWRDLAFRLVDPTHVYVRQGARTIRPVIELWAPAGDGNDPTTYVAHVLENMNRWQEATVTEPTPIRRPTVELDFPLRVDFIPFSNRNRTGIKINPTFITVHETNNATVGANAEGHRIFTHRDEGAPEFVSFHFVVDDHEAIQLLPLDEKGIHSGSEEGNLSSIAIETCVNADGDFERARRNLGRLVAKLSIEQGIPLNRVVQHNFWSPLNPCPRFMRSNGQALWRELKNNLPLLADALTCDPFPAPAFDGTPKQINDVVFNPVNRTIEVAEDELQPRRFGDPGSCRTTPEPLRRGETFTALYWLTGEPDRGEARYWVMADGSRVWVGGTVQKPEAA